jgi:hypothetical protein
MIKLKTIKTLTKEPREKKNQKQKDRIEKHYMYKLKLKD